MPVKRAHPPPPPEDLGEVMNLGIRVQEHVENREILQNLRRLTRGETARYKGLVRSVKISKCGRRGLVSVWQGAR